jgi:hypothetical protein
MSTRLRCQEAIKNFFPMIQNVRIYPTSNKQYEFTVYFENKSGQFDKLLISRIKDILPCHLMYNFKPYSELAIDRVPDEPVLPELIENLALKTTGNLKSYTDVAQKALLELMPLEIHVSMPEAVIGIKTNCQLSSEDLAKYTQHAQEIAPLGCYVSILCK